MAPKATSRTCIFCGERADTKEHLFPDWVNRLIEETSFQGQFLEMTAQGIERRRYDSNQAAHLEARIVSHRCNHHWMSDLETAASELIGPLATGYANMLGTADQLLVAQWAAKTAMVGEWIIGSKPLAFSQEDREIV